MVTRLISLFSNKKTPCFSVIQVGRRVAFFSVFFLIFIFSNCKKKETICTSCSVKFKELTTGFEGSLPGDTLQECEEAKALVGKTTVENGLAITITEVVCK